MPRFKDPETGQFISEEEARERGIAPMVGLNFNESFEKYINDVAEEEGITPQKAAENMLSREFAIIEFDEAKGQASLKFYSGSDSQQAVEEKVKSPEGLAALYHDLRENFAPVAAGVEYHKTFLVGSGFNVICDDPSDKHKIEMRDECRKLSTKLYFDYYRKGLDKILYILSDDLLTYGAIGAEIIYKEDFDFEDFMTQDENDGKMRVQLVQEVKNSQWKKLKGISRLKIIDNAYERLSPFTDKDSLEFLYWKLDNKKSLSMEEQVAKEAGVTSRGQKKDEDDAIKLLPWQVFYIAWNTRGSSLEGQSIIRPVLTLAVQVKAILSAVGKGFERWADRKYFFVCTAEGTLVWTPQGYRKIETIQVGDSVWSEHSTAEVLQTFKNPYKGDLITVKPKMLEAVSFTPNHPIKVARKKRLRTKEGHEKYLIEFTVLDGYKRADELTTNDFLIVPKIKESHDDVFVHFNELAHEMGRGYGRNPDILPSQYLSEDLAKLFGWYLAEGSINSKDYYTVQFSLNINETCYAKEILDLAWKTLGLKGKIYKKEEENSLQVVFGSKVFATFLDSWFGHGANDKHLPESFLYWNPKILQAMMSRIVFGDGNTTSKDNWKKLKLNSYELQKQLQLVLMKLGHRASIMKIKRNPIAYIKGRKINNHNAWLLSWNENNKVITEDNDNYYFRIKEITKTKYDGYVYNLHVDGSNEYYLPFRTHNCGSDKRPWNKNAINNFMTYLGLMIKNHWTGLPVPQGFDVKEIGGDVFEGTDILNYLIGLICAGMNYPRDFLEYGRTNAGDKAWLAWQVKYGSNQRQLRRDIETQLFQKHLWTIYGKTYKVPKQGVPKNQREKADIYVPKIVWHAEGRWQQAEELKSLMSSLNVANPIGPQLKLAVEKRLAELLGFGEIEFPSFADIRREMKQIEKAQELMMMQQEDKLKKRQQGGVSKKIAKTGQTQKAPPPTGGTRQPKTVKKGMPNKSFGEAKEGEIEKTVRSAMENVKLPAIPVEITIKNEPSKPQKIDVDVNVKSPEANDEVVEEKIRTEKEKQKTEQEKRESIKKIKNKFE